MSAPVESPDPPLWRQTLDAQRELHSGIGGWLLVFTCFAGLELLRAVYDAVEFVSIWQGVLADWEDFENPKMVASYVGFETITLLLTLVFCSVGLFLIFRKKRSFRKFVFVWLAFGVIVPFAQLAVHSFILDPAQREAAGGDSAGILVLGVLLKALWALYFARSERVENTFTK